MSMEKATRLARKFKISVADALLLVERGIDTPAKVREQRKQEKAKAKK